MRAILILGWHKVPTFELVVRHEPVRRAEPVTQAMCRISQRFLGKLPEMRKQKLNNKLGT